MMAIIVVPWWKKVANRISTKFHIVAVAILADSKQISDMVYAYLPDVWHHVPEDLRGSLPHYAPEVIAGAIIVFGMISSFLTSDKALEQARAIGATPEPSNVQPNAIDQ